MLLRMILSQSTRIATSGSTRAARRAGIQLASDATPITAATIATPTINVIFETLANGMSPTLDATKVNATTLSGKPNAMPSTLRRSPLVKNIVIT